MTFTIYAFLGRKHAGKNTFATQLRENALIESETKEIAFADHIKETLARMFNVKDKSVFYDQTKKETVKVFKDFTARDLMEWYGSTMREKFGESFFADIAERQIDMLYDRGFDSVIITDLRFSSEVDMIINTKYKYHIFYVDRENELGPLPANASDAEKAVGMTFEYMNNKNIPFTTIVNNDLPSNVYKDQMAQSLN